MRSIQCASSMTTSSDRAGFREQQLAQRLERSALHRRRIERDELSVTEGDVKRVMNVATEIRVHAQLIERRADLRGDALTVVFLRDPARFPHQIEDREIGNCGPERQATTLKRDGVRLGHEAQLVGQPRLPEAGIAGNADDLSLPAGRGAKRLQQRLELLVSSREGSELLVCLVDRRRARAASDDAQCRTARSLTVPALSPEDQSNHGDSPRSRYSPARHRGEPPHADELRAQLCHRRRCSPSEGHRRWRPR